MNTKTNNPTDCPKRMNQAIEFLDRKMRLHKSIFIHSESPEDAEIIDQLTRAIALLKANESMCECGVMPGDGNSALWDLERSLAGHKDMHTAFQGTPKGEYHAWAIREIEDALTILRNSMEAPKESVEQTATEVTMTHPLFGTAEWEAYVMANWKKVLDSSCFKGFPVGEKTSNLTFSEALDAVKRGKTVKRKTPVYLELGQHNSESYPICVADMIATDWSIVEDGK